MSIVSLEDGMYRLGTQSEVFEKGQTWASALHKRIAQAHCNGHK